MRDQYLGRTILITLLAAGLFGAFLLVSPDLTASGSGTASGPATTTTLVLTTTTLPEATSTTAPVASTTTIPVSTTTLPPEEWNPSEMTPENGYDGSVSMVTTALGPDGAASTAIVADGDAVDWQVVVTNSTDGELWGLYAYIEGFGRAYCDSRHLEAGESTECFASGTAYAGVTHIVAWVNAWTENRQVKDMVLVELAVAP